MNELYHNKDVVDPHVPASLRLLSQAIDDPRQSSKRAVFGVIKSLENLVGAIFVGFGGLLGAAYSGLKDGVKTTVKVTSATLLLIVAVKLASSLSPSITKLAQPNWMQHAAKIVEKALEK